jgi:chorismate mutase
LSNDPIIQSLRGQISDLDRRILEAINARITLVKRLKDHKEAQGLEFYDAAQEARVLDQLAQANLGPLSNEGLHEVFGLLLKWAKRDAARLGMPQTDGSLQDQESPS